MADEKAPSATKRAAVEAATPKKSDVRVGEVTSLVVKSPTGKPTFRVDTQSQAIHARRTEGTDTWTAAWIPPTAGQHNVTATADDADPVTFAVNATSQEG